nr:hypothetical protein [Novosphingobium pentaromativorans]
MFAQPITLALLQQHAIEPFAHGRTQDHVLKINHRIAVVEQSFEIAARGSKRYGNRCLDPARAAGRIDCGTEFIRSVTVPLTGFRSGNLQGNRIELGVVAFGATA